MGHYCMHDFKVRDRKLMCNLGMFKDIKQIQKTQGMAIMYSSKKGCCFLGTTKYSFAIEHFALGIVDFKGFQLIVEYILTYQ